MILDPNANGNIGLVCCYKLHFCIILKLTLLILRNHITHDSFKSLMAHKAKFIFVSDSKLVRRRTMDSYSCGCALPSASQKPSLTFAILRWN